jgi:hypothetical protein
MFFWVSGFMFLFGLLKKKMPRYAVWGFWITVYGCISGCCFAFLGYLTSIFNISHLDYLQVLSRYPITSQILLFASGPLFPLSILLLGINLLRARVVQLWVGVLLCLAAILFHLSRILRIETIAHIADITLLIPTVYLGLYYLVTLKKIPALMN